MKEKTFAVIPGYNEEKSIGKVVKETKKYISDVVVVDDGSRDSTSLQAEKQGAIVLKHVINIGKGAALKTGCDYAIKNGAAKIVVLDADTQHEPSSIPLFLNALEEADVALGRRGLNKNMPFIFRLGNWFINKTTKLLYGLSLHDTQCGYRAFTAEAYKKIKWKSSSYSMESEMIANIGKRKLKYKEIPIKTIYADKYKGTTVIDGIKIILNMAWWRLTR